MGKKKQEEVEKNSIEHEVGRELDWLFVKWVLKMFISGGRFS